MEISKIRQQIITLVEEILSQKNDTLIVSHGALMIVIGKELQKRGFKGEKFKNPQNGKVYTFVRDK